MENLLGVLVGALIAAIAGLLGLGISRKNEHDQWTRNQKLEVYSALIKAFDELNHTTLDERGKLKERAFAINEAVARLILLAPRKVFLKVVSAQEAVFAKQVEQEAGNAEQENASVKLAELKAALIKDLHTPDSSLDAVWLKFASRNLSS